MRHASSILTTMAVLALACVHLYGDQCSNRSPQPGKTSLIPKGARGITIGNFVTTRGLPAKLPTTVTLKRDSKALHVSFDNIDPKVVTKERKHDDPQIWQDDSVEIFLDPRHSHDDKSKWFHIIVNAGGDTFDETGHVIQYFFYPHTPRRILD